MKVGPSKMGDPKHVRVIEKLLKEEYWPMGYYCVVDWGETSHERPDIAVLKPAPTTAEDKNGSELRISNPYAWDYSSAIAVEVEMSPQKSKGQVLKNYHKNKGVYAQIRFVVTSKAHASQLQHILGEDGITDPEKYRIDEIEFETLNQIEPKTYNEDNEERQEEPERELPLGKAEEKVLSYTVAHGFTSREDIAEKCSQEGFDIGARQVSRYIKLLTEKGFLKRVGNGYESTDKSRTLPRQDTLG
jgi:hypothetical protein